MEDILNLFFIRALFGTPAMLFCLALILAPTIISIWWFFAIPWRLHIIIKLLEEQSLLLKNQANNVATAIKPAVPSYENSRTNTSTNQTKIEEPFINKATDVEKNDSKITSDAYEKIQFILSYVCYGNDYGNKAKNIKGIQLINDIAKKNTDANSFTSKNSWIDRPENREIVLILALIIAIAMIATIIFLIIVLQ